MFFQRIELNGVCLVWNDPSSWAISQQEVSALISCWVTFDPAESPILTGQNMLCTYASEYNPSISNEKSQVSLRIYIEIQQILRVYMYSYKRIQGFLWKQCWLKILRMSGFTPKSTNGGRDILSGECVMGSEWTPTYTFA